MEKINKIYIISGLGADERVFYKLDFSGFEVVFVKWIIPKKNEKIEDYARRISAQIKDSNPIILGLSFGGIIATEISKFLNVKQLILLSTAKTKYELPFYFRMAGYIGLQKILPLKFLSSFKFITLFFGKLSKQDSQLILDMIKESDPYYIKWSVNQIFNWQNTKEPKNYVHIHGTNDKIILNKNIKNKTELKNGGHFMLLEKPVELSIIIKASLIS